MLTVYIYGIWRQSTKRRRKRTTFILSHALPCNDKQNWNVKRADICYLGWHKHWYHLGIQCKGKTTSPSTRNSPQFLPERPTVRSRVQNPESDSEVPFGFVRQAKFAVVQWVRNFEHLHMLCECIPQWGKMKQSLPSTSLPWQREPKRKTGWKQDPCYLGWQEHRMHRYHLGIQSKGKLIASISKTNSIKSAWDNIAYELFLLQTGKKTVVSQLRSLLHKYWLKRLYAWNPVREIAQRVYTSPPSVYTSPLSVYTSTPSVYTSPPSVYTSPPSVYTSTPSVYTSPPSVYTSTPSVYTSPPSAHTSSPSVYTSPLSVYTSPPSVYTSPPSVYTSTPSVYTSTPSVYTSPPPVYTCLQFTSSV